MNWTPHLRSLDRIFTLLAVVGFFVSGAFLFVSYFGSPTSEHAFVSVRHRPHNQQAVSGLKTPPHLEEPRSPDRKSGRTVKPASTKSQLEPGAILPTTPNKHPSPPPSPQVAREMGSPNDF